MSVRKAKGRKLTKREKYILIAGFVLLVAVLVPVVIINLSAGPLSGSNVKIDFSDLGSLKYEIGGRQIKDWQDLGTEEIDNETLKFNARIWAECSANFYTDFTAFDVFPDAYKIETNVKYATIEKCTSPTYKSTYYDKDDYYAWYEQWVLGGMGSVADGFSGNVRMNAQLVDLKSENIEQTGIKVSSGDLTSYTRKITVTQSYKKEIGQYDDYYSSKTVSSQVSVDAFGVQDEPPTSSNSKWQPLPQLGLYPYMMDEDNTDIGQAAVVQEPTPGNDYVVDNGFNMKIVPGVMVKLQTLKLYKSDYVLVDTKDGGWWEARIGYIPEQSDNVETKEIVRSIGWHVHNYMIQVGFEIEFDVESIVSIDIDDSEVYDLEEVKLYIQDHYWNTQLGGESVTIPAQDVAVSDLWWEQNWLTVAIIGIVAITIVGIVLYVKFGGGMGGAVNINIGKGSIKKR